MCWCLQTTVARLECAGVTVSVGIAPNLSATRCERTLSGEIRETRRSTWGRFCAQSRMAAAASVAYPCPQNARVNAQPSSGSTCLRPCRWRPVTSVKDHHSSLAHHLWVGCRRFENERTNAVGSPTVEHPFDDRPDVLDRRDALSSQAVHYLRVREEVVQILRILRSGHTQAKSLGVEAVLQLVTLRR